MHSTASDGSASPSAVVAAARAASLATIALTDHDTLAGLAEARAAGDAAGVRVIAGVELSAVDGAGEEMHVLGLHIARPDGLQRAARNTSSARSSPEGGPRTSARRSNAGSAPAARRSSRSGDSRSPRRAR